MPSCAVATCTNTGNNQKERGFSFHHFPKDKEMSIVWKRRCKRKDRLNWTNAVVCSEHFAPEDFQTDKVNKMLNLPERQLLKTGATPSQNLPQFELKCNNIAREARVKNRAAKNHQSCEKLNLPLDVAADCVFEEDTISVHDQEVQTNLNWKWEMEIKDRKISRLDKSLQYKDRIISNLKTQLRALKSSQNSQSVEPSDSPKKSQLDKIFSPAQYSMLNGKLKVKWSSKDIAKSLAIASVSNTAYETLRCYWKMPLPTTRTLRAWTSNYKCTPGILTEIIDLMREEGKSMTSMEKLCVVNFDEMNIKSSIVYDRSLDEVCGPHSHVQVIMVNGLFYKWRQPIFYQYDQKVTKLILLQVITQLQSVGFTVAAVVSDLGGTNRELWNEFNISIENTSFNHPSNASKVYVFADPPHMLKLLRNHLLDGGWVLEDGTLIGKSILQQLVLFDSQEIKLCPKLNENLLNVKGAERMKVSPAAKIFSHHVATLCKVYYTSQPQISTFFQTIDDFFDIFNSRVPVNNDKKIASAYGNQLVKQTETLEKVKELVQGMRSRFFSKKKQAWTTRNGLIPCQHGILVSINSLMLMYEDLKNAHGIHYIITRRINQDPLESLFSIVRALGRTNDNPDSMDFRNRLKKILFGSKLNLPKGANVEESEDSYYISVKLIDSVRDKGQIDQSEICEETDYPDDEILNSMATEFQNPNTQAAVKHIAGYIAFVMKKKYKMELGCRTKDLPIQESSVCIDNWTKMLSRGGLLLPNAQLLEWTEALEQDFCLYFTPKNIKNKRGILKTIQLKLSEQNPNVNPMVVKEFAKLRLKIRINLLNATRKTLVKERGLKRAGTFQGNKNLKKVKQFVQ